MDPAVKEVLRYRTALRRGHDALLEGKAFDIDLILVVTWWISWPSKEWFLLPKVHRDR